MLPRTKQYNSKQAPEKRTPGFRHYQQTTSLPCAKSAAKVPVVVVVVVVVAAVAGGPAVAADELPLLALILKNGPYLHCP